MNSLSDLPALFQVRTAWAMRHEWPAGQSLKQTPDGAVSLWLVEEGALQVESETVQWKLGPGDLMLWPGGLQRTICAGQSDAEESTLGARWMTLGLCAQLFGHLDIITLLPAPHRWRPGDTNCSQLHMLIENIVQLTGATSAAEVLLRDGFCRAVTGIVWQMLSKEDLLDAGASTLPEWLQKVLAFAQKNPGATVADLTEIAAFSPAQFRRTFVRWMQISPRQYLQNQRFEAARNLLEHTELPIHSISEELHFANATHFGRTWKKRYGISPAAYRRANRLLHLNL